MTPDLFRLDGRVALITEYVEGADLDKCAAGDQPIGVRALLEMTAKVADALGINSGKAAQRVTFLVDKEGKIAKIYDKVSVKEHPKAVLADVKELVKK